MTTDPGRWLRHPCLLLLLIATAVFPLSGQSVEEPVLLRGLVLDASSRTPIRNARVHFAELRRGTLTDEGGAFDFPDLRHGVFLLTVEQYGYESQEVTVRVNGSEGPVLLIDVSLSPLPVMLDGIEVVTERLTVMEGRLRSRRRAWASSSRAFEQSRLMRTASADMLDFLTLEASLPQARCPRSAFGSWCVFRRGRAIEPRVYIDEAPVIGGLDQLSTYRPYDLYLVEVYSQGQEIRAYTHQFMERMARRPVALIPIGVGIR